MPSLLWHGSISRAIRGLQDRTVTIRETHDERT